MSPIIELRRALGLAQPSDDERVLRLLEALRVYSPSLADSPVVVADVLLGLALVDEHRRAVATEIERLPRLGLELAQLLRDRADQYALERAAHHHERLQKAIASAISEVARRAEREIARAAGGSDPTVKWRAITNYSLLLVLALLTGVVVGSKLPVALASLLSPVLLMGIGTGMLIALGIRRAARALSVTA